VGEPFPGSQRPVASSAASATAVTHASGSSCIG
jgi:hypothetical protein